MNQITVKFQSKSIDIIVEENVLNKVLSAEWWPYYLNFWWVLSIESYLEIIETKLPRGKRYGIHYHVTQEIAEAIMAEIIWKYVQVESMENTTNGTKKTFLRTSAVKNIKYYLHSNYGICVTKSVLSDSSCEWHIAIHTNADWFKITNFRKTRWKYTPTSMFPSRSEVVTASHMA